mgnify:CR=1 FL=1
MLRILKVGDQVVVNKSWSTEQRVGTVSEISIQTLACLLYTSDAADDA